MGWDAWFSLGVVAVVVGTLVFTRIAADVALIGGVTLLLLVGILTPEEALVGLSNEGMVTVGALYVVVAGLRETGGIAWLVQTVLGRPKTLFGAQTRLMAPVIAMSSILNNTPVVAMLIPAVSDWARRNRLPVSKLMIPLSYAAILGGTCTLIGTSTNLVVYGFMRQQPDLPDIGMFDIAYLGVPSAVLGLTYILVLGRWLLPDRGTAASALADPRQYTVEMLVQPNSPLIGKTIEQAGLRHLSGMFLVEIDRNGMILAAVGPQEVLRGNDRLVFAGIVESVVDLQRIRGLEFATDQVFKLNAPRPDRVMIEAVVSNTGPLVGRSVREGRFRNYYDAVVIAVAREGERIRKKIGDVVLRAGDTLLLEAHPSFVDRLRNSRDFFLVSEVADSHPPRHNKVFLALAILVAMVSVVTLEWLSMLKAAMLAAGLILMTRCCSARTARQSVEWSVLLVIAASFGLGAALAKTGAADVIAHNLIGLAGANPWASLVIVYGVTMLFTELITNNAAAALIFPIALSTANALEVSFLPFAFSLMMAASASFSTPIGYQTNLMVYGPGGYRFTDYFRIGIPLNLLLWALTATLAPLIWPFR